MHIWCRAIGSQHCMNIHLDSFHSVHILWCHFKRRTDFFRLFRVRKTFKSGADEHRLIDVYFHDESWTAEHTKMFTEKCLSPYLVWWFRCRNPITQCCLNAVLKLQEKKVHREVKYHPRRNMNMSQRGSIRSKRAFFILSILHDNIWRAVTRSCSTSTQAAAYGTMDSAGQISKKGSKYGARRVLIYVSERHY